MKAQHAFLFVALLVASTGTTFADEMPAKEAVMPKCAVADQVVMVNTKSNTYSVHQISSTADTRHQKADSEYRKNLASIKIGLKPMCKSVADAAGVKMSRKPMITHAQ